MALRIWLIAVFATLGTALVLGHASDQAGEVTFRCRFVHSPGDCGFHEQAKGPGRAMLVEVSREGGKGVRLQTLPGDHGVAGSGAAERNDLQLSHRATGCHQGAEQWWAHSVLFPDDYVTPPRHRAGSPWHWGVVFTFHHTGHTGQANFHVDAMPDGLRLRGYGGDHVDDGRFEAELGPVERNVWYDFVYHVKWSSGRDGFFDAWVNGVQKLRHRGPTLYRGQGCYLKLANYHTAFGMPSAVIHDRIIGGTGPGAVTASR
jgi:hypothetical protein